MLGAKHTLERRGRTHLFEGWLPRPGAGCGWWVQLRVQRMERRRRLHI